MFAKCDPDCGGGATGVTPGLDRTTGSDVTVPEVLVTMTE
jgi:hypothetical protein